MTKGGIIRAPTRLPTHNHLSPCSWNDVTSLPSLGSSPPVCAHIQSFSYVTRNQATGSRFKGVWVRVYDVKHATRLAEHCAAKEMQWFQLKNLCIIHFLEESYNIMALYCNIR